MKLPPSHAFAASWRCAILLAACALPARASQVSLDSGSTDLAALPLEQLVALQVTTASRFPQSIADAPSAVVLLTAQDIRDFGWRTLADALASLPGLYVTNDRNYSYLGARGFLRPGDYDSRFLLLIDGVRTNDSVYDQASIGSEGLLDMDLVQRIEYVPGPGSAMYGSNALFGVINVITKSGSAMAGPQAAVSVGSYGERAARASYGWHGQDGTDWLLAASSSRRDGQDLYFAEYAAEHGGVAHGLDFDRAQRLFAKAARGPLTLSAGYVARTKGVPTGSFGALFDTANQTRDTQAFAKAALALPLASGVDLALLAHWGRADYQGIGSYPGESGQALVNVDGDHAAWYGASAQLTLDRIQDHKIVAGVDLQRNARRDQFSYYREPYELFLDDRRSNGRSAVFVQDEWHMRPGLLLNAGLRYDRDSNAGSQFHPRLALMYRTGPADTIKLIYGTAYRAPNAYELYYGYPGEGGQQANPALSAERISTRELIFERRLDATGLARLSLFNYRMRGLIAQDVQPDSGLLMFANLQRAVAVGGELAYERQYARGLRLRTSFAMQHADDGDNAQLVNSPRRLFKLNLALPLPALKARVGAELQCGSARRTQTGMVGGYCVSNLLASSTHLLPGAELSLALYNAFNARYADPAGPVFVQEALLRQSRTISAKLAYGF
ncbi:TonB-dependent siderophore receptor [Massilia sp. Root418]|uniref:TonB-dependent receptor plug domain-containing protein n=1 Tax=Massilia sp. Root418 TaxID=1736532 RepID=UPI000ABAA692|nr:TonB-dependent receptor [Massilia sp. Root418]